MAINKAKCEAIQADVAIALATVAAKHGLNLKLQGGKFTSTTFSPKIEFFLEGQSREAEDFKIYCRSHGVSPEALNKPLKLPFHVSVGKIVGFRVRASAKPWLVEIDGKTYILTTEMFQRLLESQHPTLITKLTLVPGTQSVARFRPHFTT